MLNKRVGFIPLLLVLSLITVQQIVPAKAAPVQPVSVQSTSVASSSDLGVALQKLSELQGFSCEFEQVIFYAEGGQRNYKGELAVLRPGKFRWHYTKPYEQLYVSNGKGIWLYEPDLMQAQLMRDLGEVEPIVLQLLDGRVSLEDIQLIDKELLADGFSVWHVRIGSLNNSVEIWLGTFEQSLHWVESKDVLLNRNRLSLLEMNTKKPANETFEFIAPEGVDVIGALQ